MEYYFDQLDPVKFQRLINTILVARFGENARLTPLHGKDGGRDGETAPGNPYFEFQVIERTSMPKSVFQSPRGGRYLFQVKHHRTSDVRLSDARQTVIADFQRELKENVLKREGKERVNAFFLITNVPSSGEALSKVDKVRSDLLRNVPYLHADIWWQERVIAHLDQMVSIWSSFPDLFAGGEIPLLARVVDHTSGGMPRVIRVAVARQYDRDGNVKFRQIELEQNLAKLFVDLDIDIRDLSEDAQHKRIATRGEMFVHFTSDDDGFDFPAAYLDRRLHLRGESRPLVSALGLLLDDDKETSIRRILLEGGPGQGKSTLAQMTVQIYREQLLGKSDMAPENRWAPPQKIRLPFRLELRRFADWLRSNPDSSVEEYLALVITQDAGGGAFGVADLHTVVEKSPVLLIFDGLDEVANDQLRDDVLRKIRDCVVRLTDGLKTDLRVIITTRPPALAGRRETLMDFERLTLAPMEKDRIQEYVTRWLTVQIREKEERVRIQQSFERRQDEPHVQALARNPMQLSVLLQFIGLKGEAFPDRRAELYRDYFQIVIDRDVEKSSELRENRDVIEALHAYLGYRIHALTELKKADRTLERNRLLSIVRNWLNSQGHDPEMAQQFFRLGEERFGLIVASKGEGEETRYGYEIQPIQEYFAAAFISNQIFGNAHDVFEAMIQRSYWREVALFLAGLRRPNEKADLVARAKSVDQDRKLGWRLSGRAIVLQLLQEGVFSEPRYVFSDALDFVLDLLDSRKLKVQREPPSLCNTLEDLVTRNPLEHHQERIMVLLQDYDRCSDPYVLTRLYRIASRLLQYGDFEKAALSYKGDNLELKALVRLGWPYRWRHDVERLTHQVSFWQGVPAFIWAEVWWREVLKLGVALDLPVPVEIHQDLIVRFAVDPIDAFFNSFRNRTFFETKSRLAVWRLVRYQQILQTLALGSRLDAASSRTVQQEVDLIDNDDSEVDYSGLEESIRSIVFDVVQLSRAVIVSSRNGSIEESLEFEKYVERVGKYLEHPGLAGWVACRSAADLIGLIDSHLPVRRASPIDQFLGSLAKNLLPFYMDTPPKDPEDAADEYWALASLWRRFGRRYATFQPHIARILPTYVRLEHGGKPVALVDLIANHVCGGSSLPFEWILRMPIPSELVRPLVEKSKECLPDLLRFLGERSSVRSRRTRSLRVQDTQRILKVARHTDDSTILAGAAIALTDANFLRVADIETIERILQATSEVPFADTLFGAHRTLTNDRDAASVREGLATVEQVARDILHVPEKYGFRTVCQAADYLAEHEQIELSPLSHDESTLGISPSQPLISAS